MITVASSAAIPTWYVLAARARGLSVLIGLPLLAVAVVAGLALPPSALPPGLVLSTAIAAIALIVVGMALTLAPYRPDVEARRIGPATSGRWEALNSPRSSVPSHGTHGMGQTFAVDLVHTPFPGARPEFDSGRALRRPDEYPAFGQDLHAPCAGTVVRVHTRARDHRARSSPLAVGFLLLEGMVRELLGPWAILGNHVVLDIGDGAYVVLAHLRRGSVLVRPGDEVAAGQVVGRCGNSGNSSEPHLHLQVMDRPGPLLAAGLPFVFTGVSIDGGAPTDGVPATESTMAGEPG